MVRVPPKPDSPPQLKYINRDRILEEIKKNGGTLKATFFQELFEKEISEAYGYPVTVDDLLKPAKDGKQLEVLRKEVDVMQKGDANWY